MRFIGIGNKAALLVGACAVAVILGLSTGYAAEAQEKAGCGGWKLGSELDVLPYAMGGYYGSGFMGRDGWKFRYVIARSPNPSFLVTNGFKDKRTDAYALLADRFIGAGRRNLEGFWIGGGGEYWRNRIRTDTSPVYAHYQNYMLTAGGGCAWKFSRHFYLNPWVGSHFVVANRRDIPVSGKIYQQPVFTPEASIKLGFTF